MSYGVDEAKAGSVVANEKVLVSESRLRPVGPITNEYFAGPHAPPTLSMKSVNIIVDALADGAIVNVIGVIYCVLY